MRAVPPSIDTRNQAQKALDLAVRKAHKHYGKNMRGFVVVAWDDNMISPYIAKQFHLTNDILAEYLAGVISKETAEVMRND